MHISGSSPWVRAAAITARMFSLSVAHRDIVSPKATTASCSRSHSRPGARSPPLPRKPAALRNSLINSRCSNYVVVLWHSRFGEKHHNHGADPQSSRRPSHVRDLATLRDTTGGHTYAWAGFPETSMALSASVETLWLCICTQTSIGPLGSPRAAVWRINEPGRQRINHDSLRLTPSRFAAYTVTKPA